MTQVTVNGNTYSDDGSAARDMGNGGHRNWLLAMLSDAVADFAAKVAAALGYANAAAASAASALSAPGTSATSTTSLTIGTGSKTLTIQTGKSLVVGASVKLANTADPTKWMHGDVTAYDSNTGSLTVNSTKTNGSGTLASWTVSLSGPAGQSAAELFRATPTISGGTLTLDMSGGVNFFDVTVDAAITSIVVSNVPTATCQFYLRLSYSGAYAITFPAAWYFNGVAFVPTTLSGHSDILRLVTANTGTSWAVDVTPAVPTTATPMRLWSLSADPVSSYVFYGVGALTTDAAGNYYLAGPKSVNAGNRRGIVAKFSKDGTLQWQNLVNLNASETNGCAPLVARADSAGNVWMLVSEINAAVPVLVKMNSSGTVQSKTILHNVGNSSPYHGVQTYVAAAYYTPTPKMLAIDSSDNIYAAFHCISAGGRYQATIAKYNSALTLQWTRKVYLTSDADVVTINALCVDGSGNVYASMYSPSQPRMTIGKWNSAGTLQWLVQDSGATGPGSLAGVDGSGNVFYMVGGATSMKVGALTSAGAALWGKSVATGGTDMDGAFIAIVSGNYVHVVGAKTNGAYDIAIAALNTSNGALAWSAGVANFLGYAPGGSGSTKYTQSVEATAFGDLLLYNTGSDNTYARLNAFVLPNYIANLAKTRQAQGWGQATILPASVTVGSYGQSIAAAGATLTEAAASLSSASNTTIQVGADTQSFVRYTEL